MSSMVQAFKVNAIQQTRTSCGTSQAMTPPLSPPSSDSSDSQSVLVLPVSGSVSQRIQEIQAMPPYLSPLNPPPESEELGPLPESRKRASSNSGTPESKKAKVQKLVSDNEQSDGKESASLKSLPPAKLNSVGQPGVFALTRQGLCETLTNFKANDAGAYTRDNVVYGVLVDGGVSPRDIFTDNTIICTLGGGRVKSKSGGAVLENDQLIDNRFARAFTASKARGIPVVVIIGQHNTNCTVKLEHYYSVLGNFHIAHVWYDKYDVRGWMAKLQRVDVGVQPWWSPLGSIYVPPVLPSVAVPDPMCIKCRQPSPQIYTKGWACMFARPRKGGEFCRGHFDFGRPVDPKTLQYLPSFLEELVPFGGLMPAPVASLVPSQQLSARARRQMYSNFKQGYVCPSCGCCSRRVHLYAWTCENMACGFRVRLDRHIFTVQAARVFHGILPQMVSKMEVTSFACAGYSAQKYLFPNEQGQTIGFVAILRSNGRVNNLRGGANDMFAMMQQEEVDMKRNTIRQAGKVREGLTQQFGKNFGAPYKHAAATDSESFETAPDIILRVLKRNTWAAEKLVTEHGGAYVPPNELLCLAYTEDGAMGYHDDGEKVLGQTVTSMSLGCSATMHFRPKARNALFEPAIPTKSYRKKRDILVCELQHGDLMVMHGREIQKLYEHCVIPKGRLRFALTSRTILFDKIDGTAEDKKLAAKAGAIPARAEMFAYEGDAPVEEADESVDNAEN